MKKIISLLVFSLIFLASTSFISAANGADCGLQGSCKTACNSQTENDIGPIDCPQGGIVGGKTCCASKNIQAGCTQKNPSACNQIVCPANGTSYCCYFQTDCNNLQKNSVANNTGGTDLTKCDNGKAGIQTAIGCIPVFNQTDFLSAILKWAVGIGGGIAFLLIVYAGFMIMTASGNPERLKAGQELLTSALSGLILLVLSIFVLRFIGIDILQLGQFGFGATPTP